MCDLIFNWLFTFSCLIMCILQEFNVYQLMKDREKLFSEAELKNWCFQVFQGLAYMHQCGYFHPDLKPGNYLCWWSNLIGRRETKDISEIYVEEHKYPVGSFS
jgi:hypothetical protein